MPSITEPVMPSSVTNVVKRLNISPRTNSPTLFTDFVILSSFIFLLKLPAIANTIETIKHGITNFVIIPPIVPVKTAINGL